MIKAKKKTAQKTKQTLEIKREKRTSTMMDKAEKKAGEITLNAENEEKTTYFLI